MNPLRPGSSRTARRACACALVGGLAAALGGCGSGSSTAARPATAPGAGSASASQSLVSHLPPTTPFPQVQPLAPPAVIASPSQWTADGGLPGTPGRRNAERLTKLGFLGGVRERMGSEQRSVSEINAAVERFRTAAAARAELGYRFDQARATGSSPGRSFSQLAIAGIPGARAYAIRQPGSSSDAIAFAAGPYFYLMQSQVPAGSPNPVTLRQLETGASAWYRRAT